MKRIIRNKISIIPPNSLNADEYKKQIDDVYKLCRGIDDNGNMKEMLFQKIVPIPDNLDKDSKETDDWFLMHWGTRDKAYNACWISDYEMIFDTFWNPAIPIVYALIKKFPNTDFCLKYASDKTGTNSGEMYSVNGNIFINKEKDYSKQAFDIAFELRPHLKALYTLSMKTNTYEYDTSDIRAEIEQKGFYKDSDGTLIIGTDDKEKPLFNGIDDLPF